MLKPGFTLVPKAEHRVYLGTGVFVGIVLLVGWIAISEPARMQVFTQTYHARSVENGATIFINNCATCHGADGKGQAGVAPAIDNPMLFLSENPAAVAKSKLDDLNNQQALLQQMSDSLKKLVDDQAKYAAMSDTDKNADAGVALKKEIDSLKTQTAGNQLDDVSKQITDLGPKIQDAQKTQDDLTQKGWDPKRDVRLKEVQWGGSLHDYLYSTITSGRPVSATYWPKPMPAWGQAGGGQLRPDEVEDVTQYILNFQDEAVDLVPADVHQQFINPSLLASGGSKEDPVGVNFDYKAFARALIDGTAIDLSKRPIKGDPKNGLVLYTNNACAACHAAPQPQCPPTAGSYTRVVNDRMKAGSWASPEEYLLESILVPNAYVVPNYPAGLMPGTFATKLTRQDLADILAYLETQK
ncbi:MAG TPA: c-type cytochrome [Aggregatilineales bacterium]|nr:c-type cytochrome [Aggregatilineales bacterium]